MYRDKKMQLNIQHQTHFLMNKSDHKFLLIIGNVCNTYTT